LSVLGMRERDWFQSPRPTIPKGFMTAMGGRDYQRCWGRGGRLSGIVCQGGDSPEPGGRCWRSRRLERVLARGSFMAGQGWGKADMKSIPEVSHFPNQKSERRPEGACSPENGKVHDVTWSSLGNSGEGGPTRSWGGNEKSWDFRGL